MTDTGQLVVPPSAEFPSRYEKRPMTPARWIPLTDWLRDYRRDLLARDLIAAVIVTLMLVPQALAYALLAGLPPEVGLYASMLPLVLYALFSTSTTLAVGPVAITSLTTASALSDIAAPWSAVYVGAALVLAALSGLLLVAMGMLRLGFLANFLSHPVISGFVAASGILIATSQLRHVLGVEASGDNLVEMVTALVSQWQRIDPLTWPSAAASGATCCCVGALHLAEVKGPVMDRLKRTKFFHTLTGQVFLSTYDAWRALHKGNASSSSPATLKQPVSP